MDIHYAQKLSTRLFTPLVVIFTLVIILLVVYIPGVTERTAVESAVKSAEATVKQYKAIRGYYTQNVVKKVISGSDLRPHFHHKDDPTKIPLPATFIHDISEEFAKQGIVSIKLYSPFPFPVRGSREMDQFGKDAWVTLNKDPTQTFIGREDMDGEPVVRVALADTMAQQGCVDCHNAHPDTPRRGWELNDVRGILEVQIPIKQDIAAARSLNFLIAGFVLVALLTTVALLFIMYRKMISERLRAVASALSEIAHGDGDLTKRLKETPKDEIGSIAVSFNQFVNKLEASMKQIGIQVKQLGRSTESMESISETAQSSIDVQKKETEQVASAMNEMTSTSQEMSSIANETFEQTNQTYQQSEQGRKVVAESMDAVSHLHKTMEQASEVVNSLEQDSQNITSVLDVIGDIAEQTNLLALNAAIEAARAGEQGRGFAVVADEVRTLASRTQDSTQEINKMIEKLQNGAKNAVSTINQGSKAIENSLEKAQETNQMIDNIADAVTNIQSLNQQIAAAVNEQTQVSEEINKNVLNIADSTSETQEGSHKVLGMAEEVSAAVRNIQEQLKTFTYRTD